MRNLIIGLFLFLALATQVVSAQSMGPSYSSNYTVTNLGSVPGLPTYYGGLTFEAGDPNVLLIAGDADSSGGAIYAVNVVRNGSQVITGFSGNASLFATAPYIDGGLAYASDGTLFYTTYSNNTLGQILPGNTSAAIVSNLTALGVASSSGSLAFTPDGFPAAGRLLVSSYSSSNLYSMPYSANGNGTYALSNATLLNNLPGGIEGIAFVAAGNPGFSDDSVLISEYTGGQVLAYALDGSGNLTGSSSVFVTGVSGAEGAAVDPVTGDFLFSTYGSTNKVLVVSGFSVVPEPADCSCILGALALGLGYWRNIRQRR